MDTTLKKLVENFAQPDDSYRPQPFWFWNDDLREEHLLYQLDEMQDKGISTFLIHARMGLSVPYLSEEWFDKFEFILSEAQKRGMKLWIYDEENWPSGYAGGRVLAEDENHCGKYLRRFPAGQVPEGLHTVSSKDGWEYAWGYLHYHPAYSQSYYVDMLSRRATECFIRTTHEKYAERFSDQFGKTILGFFVDEPGFYNNFEMYAYCEDPASYIWNEELPAFFEREKGYRLLENLDLLYGSGAESDRLKCDFYDAAASMYAQNFLRPLADFCHSHGMRLIGHLHSEEFLPYHVKTQGNMLRCLNELDWSGVDRIDVNPEKVTEKYGSSAQHIYGKERTMSETFCLSGWDLTLRRMRRWTDWQYVRGVNAMVLHAFYSSIEGDRKWECPPTLFFQTFHWKYFKQYTDYCARLSYVLSQGAFCAPAAVYYPITTQQSLVEPDSIAAASAHDRLFLDVSNRLLDSQLDFDYIGDDVLKAAEVRGGKLWINRTGYRFVVLVDLKNIPYSSLKKLAEFVEGGGSIVNVGHYRLESLGDCTQEEFDRAVSLLPSANWCHLNEFWYNKPYTYEFSPFKLRDFVLGKGYQEVRLAEFDADIKYQHRAFEDGELYFFVNESGVEKRFEAEVKSVGNVYRLDPMTGKRYRCQNYQAHGGRTLLKAQICAYGEAIYLISPAGLPFDEVEPLRPTDCTVHAVRGTWELSCPAFSGRYELQSWDRLGYPEYSGQVVYRKSIELEPKAGKRYVLSFERVCHTVEVTVNGKKLADLIWDPYEVDITEALCKGENCIELLVANTLANELEHRAYPSGLIGEVKIYEYEE